jgi:hypothetical protein
MNRAHLESLREHFSNLLLAKGTGTLEDFGVTLHFALLLTAASTRTNGATKNLGSPPTADGTV